jgi:hypothetical protein
LPLAAPERERVRVAALQVRELADHVARSAGTMPNDALAPVLEALNGLVATATRQAQDPKAPPERPWHPSTDAFKIAVAVQAMAAVPLSPDLPPERAGAVRVCALNMAVGRELPERAAREALAGVRGRESAKAIGRLLAAAKLRPRSASDRAFSVDLSRWKKTPRGREIEASMRSWSLFYCYLGAGGPGRPVH